MKKWIVVAFVVLVGMVPLRAQNLQSSQIRFFDAYAMEALTVDATAGGVAFTANKVTTATRKAQQVQFRVVCATVSPCSINFTVEGTAPTASVGFPLNENEVWDVFKYTNITRFKAIRSGANSAVLRVIYYY